MNCWRLNVAAGFNRVANTGVLSHAAEAEATLSENNCSLGGSCFLQSLYLHDNDGFLYQHSGFAE